MKRILCICLTLVLLLSLGIQAFADDLLFCRMCGKQIPADSKVCQYCGEKVVHPDSAAVPAAAATPASPAPAAAATASPAPAAAPGVSAASPATAAAAATPGPFNTLSGSTSQSGRLRITKSPTSESVPYGGSCMFIAHADNATSVTWYIATPDASLITTAAEAPSRVAGLSVSGSSSDTLSLSGIPSWMNGCQVQACFTGEGGPVYSEIARIWTYQPAQQQKRNWSVWDWYGCNDWDCPWYWDYPCYWDYAVPLSPDSSISYTDHVDGSLAPDNHSEDIWETDSWAGQDNSSGYVDTNDSVNQLSGFPQMSDIPVMQEPPVSGIS